MRYPATFKPAEEGGFVVTFRDIPEAITQGDSLEEAREMAADALLAAMDFYFEDGRPVPAPSKVKRGDELVSLPASVWAKVLLLNEMASQGIRPAELARRMGIKPQEVNRIVKLDHTTKIDTLADALRAMGKQLSISIDG